MREENGRVSLVTDLVQSVSGGLRVTPSRGGKVGGVEGSRGGVGVGWGGDPVHGDVKMTRGRWVHREAQRTTRSTVDDWLAGAG